MDDADASPDSAGCSILTNQKKDKVCLVCGDKALGYNFNAVSCESCKAFFRRNAHKTIRGRCEGKCDVNVESRSFCKRCRLAKCFTVGMRKDMILDDDQKKLRKQKILINKLRRHGTLPPEDTYAVSENDLRHSYNQKIIKSSITSLKKQYPSMSTEEINCLQNMKTDKTYCDNTQEQSGSGVKEDYEPWKDIKSDTMEIIAEMDESDKHILLEMNAAHENSSFLSSTQTKLKSLPTTPTEMFNIADGFVRRIIKVVKQLEFFRRIEKDDQIALLKGSVFEIMMLRSAVNFDIKTETWTLSTKKCISPSPSGSSSTVPSSTITSAEAGNTETYNVKPTEDLPAQINFEELKRAARSGADINALRNMARNSAGSNGNVRKMDESENYGQPRHMLQSKVMNRSIDEPVNINELRKAAMSGADLDTLRQIAKGRERLIQQSASDLPQKAQLHSVSTGRPVDLKMTAGTGNIEHLRDTAKSAGLDIDALRNAAMSGADLDTLRQMAKGRERLIQQSASDLPQKAQLHSVSTGRPVDLKMTAGTDNIEHLRDTAKSAGLDIDALRNAAMNGADLNTLRHMAKGREGFIEQSAPDLPQKAQLHSVTTDRPVDHNMNMGSNNIEQLRNTAKSAGLDIDALRNAAMNGASFEDLARMARGETAESGGGTESSSISSEILKMGNSETRTMFLTYSKFIRSLMKTIHGDLIVLKFLMMLSLFSCDRQGIENHKAIEQCQETYAHVLQKYIDLKFPDNKNMFAQCIMKLTDLRNVNEVHTKMLLKMQVQDIEPLLIEIFDLPQ